MAWGCPLLVAQGFDRDQMSGDDGVVFNLRCEACSRTWTEVTRRTRHEPIQIPPMSPVSANNKL